MKLRNIFNMACSMSLMAMVMFSLSACEDSEEQDLFDAGSRLTIVGGTSVKVGDVDQEYFVQNSTLDNIYDWSVENGVTITKDDFNDAFVYLTFNTAGKFNLQADNGGAQGAKTIEVSSRALGFSTSSDVITEGIMNDTIAVPLMIDGGLRGNVTITYDITGSIDEDHYKVVEGFESPLTLNDGSDAEIKLVLMSNDQLGEEDIILTITNISSDLAGEYVLTDSTDLTSIQYSIVDDLKKAYLDTETVVLEEQATVMSIPVKLMNPSLSSVEVSYSIDFETGVLDATPTKTPNTLVFDSKEVEKEIVLSINSEAFSADQVITVTLTGINAIDGEVSLSDQVTKALVIDVAD